MKNLEECDCTCHRFPGAKHCMPCCSTCPVCKKRIKFAFINDHASRCRRAHEQAVLLSLVPRIRAAWCRETASPSCQASWSPSNPSRGQCAVTAEAIRRLVGGEVLRTVVPGDGSHYYNRLPSGDDLDLTDEQFPEGTVIPPGDPRDSAYVLDSPGAVTARTRERFELLLQRIGSVQPAP
jgi:hypothetical protein